MIFGDLGCYYIENRFWYFKVGVVMFIEDVVVCLYEVWCDEMELKFLYKVMKGIGKISFWGKKVIRIIVICVVFWLENN